MLIFKKVSYVIVFKVLLVIAFGFFTETAMAGKTYDALIRLHNNKIKATTFEAVAPYNDKINGILGGSKGFSNNYLTDTEKANTTYIAIHAALTTPGTAEGILLEKVFTDSNLRHLDTTNRKIITHYVNVAILYLAAHTVNATDTSDSFKLLMMGKIGRLAESNKLSTNLKTALKSITETKITNTLQRLNFGQTYHFIKRQIHKRQHGVAETELITNSLPSLTMEECHFGRGRCGERGNTKGKHHSRGPHHGRPPFTVYMGAPPIGNEGLSPPPIIPRASRREKAWT